MPTKTQIRFGSRISTRGERCEYFDGSAYLLDLRCLLVGRGDDVDVDVVTVVATFFGIVRERFVDGRGATDEGTSFSLAEPLTYWYFVIRPLKDAGGGDERTSGGSDSSLLLDGIAFATALVCVERVRGILKCLRDAGTLCFCLC